jgi:hypothetical protein
MTLKFSDGITIDTDGPYHATHLADGWYVTGHGLCCPVADAAEADEMIHDLLQQKTRED